MMTDLHTHILPGMDDGAPDVETALELLNMELLQGVKNIALTSHFHCEKMTLENFLDRRERAYTCIQEVAEEQGKKIQFRKGSEVFFSPRLLQMDLQPLCMEGTDVLLIELPVQHCPPFLREGLFQLRAEGFLPLIAHVERYDYVRSDPALLAKWIDWGAYAQVNAGSILAPQGKQVLNLIRWGLVQAVASDTHSLKKRPPNMAQAFQLIKQNLGEETVERLEKQAFALFEGEEPEIGRVHVPKRLGPFWI